MNSFLISFKDVISGVDSPTDMVFEFFNSLLAFLHSFLIWALVLEISVGTHFVHQSKVTSQIIQVWEELPLILMVISLQAQRLVY
jgi:uncharacterized membrane protein YkvI